MDNHGVVYSALEAAKLCGVVNQTAINWIHNGYLSAFRTPGGQYRIYFSDLIAFMMKRNIPIPDKLKKDYQNMMAEKSLLVIHNNKGINFVIAKYLKEQFPDFTVFQAFDGFEAGTLLAREKFFCVLLDLELPGVNCFDLCRKIHISDEFGCPDVIAVSAKNTLELKSCAEECGASFFCGQPLNLGKIIAAVKTCRAGTR
ncbi:MAG: response regulator [Bacteroides sp.]|nr:response regulator [Prevotella sp.]MCM1407765.1 response regulator [Treponema brennaborense]MCM1468887.1 response regulator [Bacteroides sp.]